MLRITVQNGNQPPVVKLEGRLTGPWVAELLRTWNELSARRPGERVRLDLSDVTFVDMDGKTILGWMAKKGAKLENARLLTKYIVDQIEQTQNLAG